MTGFPFLSRFVLVAGLLIFTALGWARPTADKPKEQGSDSKQVADQPNTTDPLNRPLTEKEKKQRAKALKQELSKAYKERIEKMMYIITPEELEAFAKLTNDEERDHFIELIWDRHNPSPDSPVNEFKEEYFRRLAYANDHFTAGIPGWKTDRGMIYIKFGPPDHIESNPGGSYVRPIDEGGGTTSAFPFEDWHYRHIDDIGDDITVEFVDDCQCGAYEMTFDRSKKDALRNVPNAGPTTAEEMGITSKSNRFTNGTGLGLDPGQLAMQQGKQFDDIIRYFGMLGQIHYKLQNLREHVGHIVGAGPLPFDVRADFVKVTSDTVLVPVTIQLQNKDISFESKDGVARGLANIYGSITTMTGKVVQTFEDTVSVEVPSGLLDQSLQNHSIYWKAIPLHPGRYLLEIAVKDPTGSHFSSLSKALTVPDFNEDKLAASTLILADKMEKVARNTVGSGTCVIGDTKVCPRVEPADGKPAGFHRGQKVNFWMQVYNLGIDEQSKKSSATIEYDVVNVATNNPVVHLVESTESMGNVGDKITLEKSMPLGSLEPGIYRLTIKVNDKVSKQTISPSANFAVQ